MALAGCMKIYPDPELPDVKVTWGEQDCRDGSGNVEVTLTGIDTTSTETLSVPCTDMTVSFVNVARQRFHVAGTLLDTAGQVFVESEGSDVDLRNGFNEETGLYFEGFSNFRVTWMFDSGATCASLGARDMVIYFSLPDMPDLDIVQYPCELPRINGSVPPDTYTAQLRALDDAQDVVAVSPVLGPFVITETGFTNLGNVIVTPCGAGCP